MPNVLPYRGEQTATQMWKEGVIHRNEIWSKHSLYLFLHESTHFKRHGKHAHEACDAFLIINKSPLDMCECV